MYANPQVAQRLPPESQMDREDALQAFIAVCNTVEPEHPYLDDPWPITAEDVDYGVTRSYYAKCGPRRGYRHVASYSTRLTYINSVSRARHLALLTHEVTHIPVCSGLCEYDSGHPPDFWREMAFHALELRDALQDGVLHDVFGDVDVEGYLEAVVADPNSSTVDRRSWSVEDCRERMRELVGLA